MGDVIFMQGLHPGPQVADAHGGGNAVALYLAEGLHLDAAGQRGEAIGPKMLSCREKADPEEDQNFDKEGELPPVQAAHVAKAGAHSGGQGNAQGKADHRQQIPQAIGRTALRDGDGEQQNIAGLGIGKDMAPGHVAVSIHKAPGQRQQDANGQRGGHLAVFLLHKDHCFPVEPKPPREGLPRCSHSSNSIAG